MCQKLQRTEKISKAKSLALKKLLIVYHMIGTSRDAKVLKRVLEQREIITTFSLTYRTQILTKSSPFLLPQEKQIQFHSSRDLINLNQQDNSSLLWCNWFKKSHVNQFAQTGHRGGLLGASGKGSSLIWLDVKRQNVASIAIDNHLKITEEERRVASEWSWC